MPSTTLPRLIRLAVVVSHPIQYYAPWFAHLAGDPYLLLHVFYLWDFGIESRLDLGFEQSLKWDVPLLEGYSSSFVPNLSPDPGTHHFCGLHNPTLVSLLRDWCPDVVLLFGYAFRSHLQLLLDPRLRHLPILLRGDSHHLASRPGWKPRALAFLRRLLFRRFSGALAVGQANAAWLRASGVAASRIVYAPHAVDNLRFQAAAVAADADACRWREEFGIAADAPIVLFAGKFDVVKRPLDLLSAFAALQHPNAVLMMVGSGQLTEELRRHASTLPDGRVVFLSLQKPERDANSLCAGRFSSASICIRNLGVMHQ